MDGQPSSQALPKVASNGSLQVLKLGPRPALASGCLRVLFVSALNVTFSLSSHPGRRQGKGQGRLSCHSCDLGH